MRLHAFILFFFSILPIGLALQLAPTRPRPWIPSDPCPTSITAKIIANPCADNICVPDYFDFTTLESVHSALLTCPNMSSLDLSIDGFCSTWPDRRNLPFNHLGGERYVDLKVLKLDRYSWDWRSDKDVWTGPECCLRGKLDCFMDTLYWFYKGHWKSWLKWRKQPKAQREKTNVELWLDAMDWTAIEELSVESVPDSVRKVLSQSRALRMLKTTDIELITNLPNNTLTHLSFCNGFHMRDYLPDILNHQGESLQSLELRWHDDFIPMQHFGGLDGDFDVLASHTSNLSHLSVNVLYNDTTWPFETIEKIATIPTLRKVDLWMDSLSKCSWPYDSQLGVPEAEILGFSDGNDSGCESKEAFHKIHLDSTSASKMFKHMKEKKQGDELEEATFWEGNWSTEWDGETSRVKVVCKAKTDLNMEEWCMVEQESDDVSQESFFWDESVFTSV